MTLPKGYKHTEIGILPNDWEVAKLGEVCKIKKGKQLNKLSLKSQGSYPVINGGVLPSGYTDEFNTRANTITISEGGNSCGFINYIHKDFWSGGHCYTLEDLKIFDLFLFFALKYREKRIQQLRVGSGLPNIQKGDLEEFAISFPSVAEQEKIAEILSTWDSQIQNIESLIAEKQNLKKGLSQNLLSGQLRFKEFKEEWEVVRLGEVCELKRGKSITKKQIKKGNIPVIAGGREPAYYHNEANRAGQTIAVAGSGAYAGYISFWDSPIFVSDAFSVVPADTKKAFIKFIFYYLQNIQNDIYKTQKGTGTPHVYPNSIKNFQIPLPPLAEQEKIAGILSALDSKIDLLKSKLNALKTQKQGLMQTLLTGKARVKI